MQSASSSCSRQAARSASVLMGWAPLERPSKRRANPHTAPHIRGNVGYHGRLGGSRCSRAAPLHRRRSTRVGPPSPACPAPSVSLDGAVLAGRADAAGPARAGAPPTGWLVLL